MINHLSAHVIWCKLIHILIQDIQLFGTSVLLKQLAGHLALCGQDDAVGCEDAEGGAGVRDGFQCILDLVEPALGGENGRAAVVPA